MEAEYVTFSLAIQEAMWLRSFLQDLNLTPRVDDPIEMLCDNTTAIQFAKDPKFHRKTKYINKRYDCAKRHKLPSSIYPLTT